MKSNLALAHIGFLGLGFFGENQSHWVFTGLYACAKHGVNGNVGACDKPIILFLFFGTVPNEKILVGKFGHPLFESMHSTCGKSDVTHGT